MTEAEMMTEITRMQDRFNKSVEYFWRDKQFDWRLAAADECMELCNHVGWKWWIGPKESSGFQQLLEIVDIFCFFVSDQMIRIPGGAGLIPEFIRKSEHNIALPKIDAAKMFARKALAGSADCTDFARLCRAFNVNFNSLYRAFVCKHALNHHRQVNGYSVGEYNKTWKGSEDNVHLEELYMQLGLTENKYLYDEMVKHLQFRYDQIGHQ